MEKVIEVQGLKREYITKTGWFRRKQKKVTAVNGIDFSVERGEIFGLLGENGAGKTTTIKILITLLAPTEGSCKVLGMDTYQEAKKIRPKINFIFGGAWLSRIIYAVVGLCGLYLLSFYGKTGRVAN